MEEIGWMVIHHPSRLLNNHMSVLHLTKTFYGISLSGYVKHLSLEIKTILNVYIACIVCECSLFYPLYLLMMIRRPFSLNKHGGTVSSSVASSYGDNESKMYIVISTLWERN